MVVDVDSEKSDILLHKADFSLHLQHPMSTVNSQYDPFWMNLNLFMVNILSRNPIILFIYLLIKEDLL